jgi:tellurite resistance protein TerC
MTVPSIGSPLLWAGFIGFVLVMLALDLGLFHRREHVVGLKEAGLWSLVWVSLSALFGLGLWAYAGPDQALEFTAAYVIEKALAVDNLFVFAVVFATFGVSAVHQHRVLFWGVLGALVLRAIFILAGGALLANFHWTLYVFGGLLVITGARLLIDRGETPRPELNPVVRAFRAVFPVTTEPTGAHFVVRVAGRLHATPLLLALVAVEVSDVIFAVDSIPAIFAVTRDPFLVFTSNIFAILGLRSMYFLLAQAMARLGALKIGLAFVLLFVGAKMLLTDVYHVPVGVSLGIIAGILAISVVVSLLRPLAVPPGPIGAPAPSAPPPA